MVGSAATEITERIRQANDIVHVISAYVSLKQAGRSLKGLCPFHQERTPSFHVTPERQTFKCFGCGAGGDVFKFIQLRENLDFLGSRDLLATRAGISLEVPRKSETSNSSIGKADLDRVNRWAARWFERNFEGPSGQAAREYAQSRGISDESMKSFCLGFAPASWDAMVQAASGQKIPSELLLAAGLAKRRDDGSLYDAFRNRLMFPIIDPLGRTIAFGGRALGDDDAKYINSPQSALFDKSRCLYGLSTAKDAFRQSPTAVVVEGYLDCLLAQQFGFVNVVATLGTALTRSHVDMLGRYVESVTLVFDSDAAGQRAAEQSLPLFLSSPIEVKLARVREGKDPADLLVSMGEDAFKQTLTSACPALEWKWRHVSERYRDDAASGNTTTSKRRAVEEFLSLIAGSVDFGACDPIQRGLLLNQIGKLLGLSSEEISRQLRMTARRAVTPLRETSQFRASQLERLADPRAVAMRELVEVLINAPHYYDNVAGEFAPELLPDGPLREIAVAVAEMAPHEAGFEVAALVSRFESIETASLIMELQSRGEQKGNHDAAVAGAVECLRRHRQHESITELNSHLRKSGGNFSTEGEDETMTEEQHHRATEDQMRAMTQAARKTSHFAARKHLAAPLTVGAVTSGPSSVGLSPGAPA